MSKEETEEWARVKAYREIKALDNGLIGQHDPHGLKLKHHYLVVKGKLLRFNFPRKDVDVPPKQETIEAVDEHGQKWSLTINRLYPNDLAPDLKELRDQLKTFQHDTADFNQTEMVIRKNAPLVYEGATKTVIPGHHFEHFSIQAIEPKVIDTLKTEAQLRVDRTRAESYLSYVQITLQLIQVAPNKKDIYAKELSDLCHDLQITDDEKLEVLQTVLNGFPKENKYYEDLQDQFISTLVKAPEALPKNDKTKSYFETAFSFNKLKELLKMHFEKLFPPPKVKSEPLSLPEFRRSPAVVPRSREPKGPSLGGELAAVEWTPSNPTKQKNPKATKPKTEDNLKKYEYAETQMIEALTDKAFKQSSQKSLYESALNYGAAGHMLILKDDLKEATRILELAKVNAGRSQSEAGAQDFAKDMEHLLTLCKKLEKAERLANQQYNPEDNAKHAISIYLKAIQYVPQDHELHAHLYTKALQVAEKHGLTDEAAPLREMVKDQFTKAIEKTSDPQHKAFLELKQARALPEEKPARKNAHSPGKAG